ncbi:MAG: hypothetical protein E7052_00265 [Lentisphaerae bacterium]|nr:hypothetical protein [Lentisphaerota bacterium]
MLKAGYAQEVMTPPAGVGLAGYFNERPNEGMFDDLFVKVIAMEIDGKRTGLVSLELCNITGAMFTAIKKRVDAEFGEGLYENLLICATHTHTGPKFVNKDQQVDELHQYAFDMIVDAVLRALKRAFMSLLPAELEATKVFNNPYGFVRRYWMTSGDIVTNPGWRNPNIDKPECDYDRTINILALKQGGRIAALICNIANHGDTIGGNLVSADWYGRFVQAVQHELKSSLPVMVLDDASGNINHFDFHQQINQTGYHEAVRIGRGYARIVLDALSDLQPVAADKLQIKNTTVTIPHRQLTDAEVAAAQNILDTVPDIKKDGDFESQDLANKVPAALRYFAQRALDCKAKSVPSHDCRLTAIEIGNDLAFVSLPGEPFNGIAQAIREASSYKYTFIAELAQSPSGYVPMKECFARGGYEVQPGVDTVAPEAAEAIIEASIKNI